MKLDTDLILTKIKPVLVRLNQYRIFIFVLIFLGIYLYLVQHIGTLIQTEPTPITTETDLKPVTRLKVDQESVKQMTQLESQNIEVKTLFDNARGNPFTED